MTKRKIMILGAGQCQVPIILKAKEKGFYTVVASIDGLYPGFKYADQVYKIDIRQKEKLLTVAKRENICGILTDQTDIPVSTVAFIAEKMKLPGIGYECARAFTNKHLMLEKAKKNNIPVPVHYKAENIDDACDFAKFIGFPVIVKPADNQGSRGVFKINNEKELKNKYKETINHSKCGYIIIEEYFIGKEIVIEGFVTDYKYHDLVIGDREYFNLPNLFIPSKTIFPSNLGIELQNKITEANKSLIDNFNPRFGITHSEFLVNEDSGEFRLVETAIRGGGVYISSDLIPLGCGVDVNDLLIDIVTGNEETVNFEDEIIQQGSGYICFYLPKGIIKSIHGVQKIRQIKEVHKIYLDDICIGQKTDNILDKTMRLGPILIKGINRLACNDTVDKIKNILNIKVETNFGTKGICWQ